MLIYSRTGMVNMLIASWTCLKSTVGRGGKDRASLERLFRERLRVAANRHSGENDEREVWAVVEKMRAFLDYVPETEYYFLDDPKDTQNARK